MKCENCGIDFQPKREGAKYCSPRCRKEAFNKRSVGTDNLAFQPEQGTVNFEFYTITKANGTGRKDDEKSIKRVAKYWYDVPLSAVPVIQKDWPKMPEYMNGRQYFLWWKNEFKAQDDGTPIIHNPFPDTTGAVYVKAGEGSRYWGTV